MRSSFVKGKTSLALACLCLSAFTAATASAQSVIANVQLANSPNGIGVNPFAGKVYVAVGNAVQVIDQTTNAVVNRFNLPTEWTITDVKPNPATGLIYVATELGGLFVVSPKTYLPTAFINANAATLAINPFTNKIYASDFQGSIYAIDGATNTIDAIIPVTALENIAVNPVTNRIYAAQDLFPGKVTVIDGKTNQVITSVAGGGYLSFDVAVDPYHNKFYSSDEFGTVSIFDGATNTLQGSVAVSGQPAGLSVDPWTQKVYAMNYSGNVVDVIDGAKKTLIQSIPVGTSPEYSDFDPARGILYVGNSGAAAGYTSPAETLSVIKTR